MSVKVKFKVVDGEMALIADAGLEEIKQFELDGKTVRDMMTEFLKGTIAERLAGLDTASKIEHEIDRRVSNSVRDAVAAISGSRMEAEVRAVIERLVSREVADKYTIDVVVAVNRKDVKR